MKNCLGVGLGVGVGVGVAGSKKDTLSAPGGEENVCLYCGWVRSKQ